MEPTGYRSLIHEPIRNRTSWGAHAIEGCYASPALHHYRNFTFFYSKTRVSRVSDIVEFRHDIITTPEQLDLVKLVVKRTFDTFHNAWQWSELKSILRKH